MKFYTLLFASLIGFSLVASANTAAKPVLPNSVLSVPLVTQKATYSCGAAAFLSIMKYWLNTQGDEKQFYSILHTTKKDGTNPYAIFSAASSFNLSSVLRENLTIEDLRTALQQGQTVILSMQAWPDEPKQKISWTEDWDDGHYVVLIGLDDYYLYAMDPSTPKAYVYVPILEFLDRWHDEDDVNGKPLKSNHLGVFISNSDLPAGAVLWTQKLRRLL